ncbi:hypothetical protein BDQ17DRAFT_1347600 [Cyathus striatus]|nr:hypothetical protein BDQ17DRAFT_1347600 [Cyathus striatus]
MNLRMWDDKFRTYIHTSVLMVITLSIIHAIYWYVVSRYIPPPGPGLPYRCRS